MDLTTLKSTTLKLYLVLIAQRDQAGICRLSQRRLSQQAGLARNTLALALDQLEGRSLVASHPTGWTVDPAPLAALIGLPALVAGGSKIEPPTPSTGSKIEPPCREIGSKTEPLAPSLDAPARTL